MKKYALVLAGVLLLSGVGTYVPVTQTAQAQEFHPRIATAIRELEAAIAYLEAAPHDFGGHKVAAIRDARAAIIQLRLALAYRGR